MADARPLRSPAELREWARDLERENAILTNALRISRAQVDQLHVRVRALERAERAVWTVAATLATRRPPSS